MSDAEAPGQLPESASVRVARTPAMDDVRTLIIGAGVTGLATAAALSGAGDDDSMVQHGFPPKTQALAEPDDLVRETKLSFIGTQGKGARDREARNFSNSLVQPR